MNKRKIMMLALSVMMIAILTIGGTLAYFTAEGGADNVFTMGGVDIELEEEFEQESELKPGVDVNKDVWVNNTGTSDAYARVHIAIPSNMDDGNPSFNPVNNFLHFNFEKESVQDGLWTWKKEMHKGVGYGDNWNFYTMTIDDVDYNVYVVTHRSAITPGMVTTKALDKVYLDPSVEATVNRDPDTKEIISYTYKDNHNNEITLTPAESKNIKIKVWAEATQTDPFTDPFTALNTVFGVPGTYNPWAE